MTLPQKALKAIGKNARGILFSVLIALPFALALRSSVLESFTIPTGSMIPTILIGDRILVWKGAYRWKLPFTELLSDPVILKQKEGPARGDVVVFRYPHDLTLFYIKRVIGVSGDWVAIKNRKLYVNDAEVKAVELPLEGGPLESLKDADIGSLKDYLLMEENIDERKHLILRDRNQFVSERYGPVAVPPGHVFVMGDNRDFSNDSRFWGFVPLSLVEGRALAVWMHFQLGFEPLIFRLSLRRFGRGL